MHRLFLSATPALLLVAGLVVLSSGPGAPWKASLFSGPEGSGPPDPSWAAQLDEVVLRPGNVIVLARWRCSYLQLARANELALSVIEDPMVRMVDQGRILGWGQFNGDIRDEFNYITFYVAPSMADYRRALGAVMDNIAGARAEEMREFYRLCDRTEEVSLTVVTARR